MIVDFRVPPRGEPTATLQLVGFVNDVPSLPDDVMKDEVRQSLHFFCCCDTKFRSWIFCRDMFSSQTNASQSHCVTS